jgi:hypothetical protein
MVKELYASATVKRGERGFSSSEYLSNSAFGRIRMAILLTTWRVW